MYIKEKMISSGTVVHDTRIAELLKSKQGGRKMPVENDFHHVPGRLRVRIPQVKEKPGTAQNIQELLDLQGVIDVRIKNITGSVVVQYDPKCLQHEQLLKVLTENGYYDNAREIPADDRIYKPSSRTAEKVGKVLFGWGVSKALEATGLPLLAALI